MPDDKVLQVAILIWGCAFCAIAALCMFLSSNYDREKRRYLILMESFASLLLLMDAMAHIFSGYPGVPGSVMVIIPGLFEPPVRTLRATIPENESHIFR